MRSRSGQLGSKKGRTVVTVYAEAEHRITGHEVANRLEGHQPVINQPPRASTVSLSSAVRSAASKTMSAYFGLRGAESTAVSESPAIAPSCPSEGVFLYVPDGPETPVVAARVSRVRQLLTRFTLPFFLPFVYRITRVCPTSFGKSGTPPRSAKGMGVNRDVVVGWFAGHSVDLVERA